MARLHLVRTLAIWLPLWGTANVLLLGAEPGELKWVAKNPAATVGTAQHTRSVARPLNAAASSRTAADSPVTVLRWRSSEITQTAAPTGTPTQPVRIVTVTSPNTAAAAPQYSVRQVSANDLDLPAAIPDAFDDPFEDGAARPPAPRPHTAQQIAAPLPIEPAMQLVAQAEATLDTNDAAWQDDPAPAPQSDLPLEPQPQPQPLPQPLPQPSTIPEYRDTPGFAEPQLEDTNDDKSCDRVYNRRDCCADDQRCTDARERWQRDAISKISLDITPSMHPEEDDPVEQERQRDRDLAGSPSRVWQDRQGNVLAEGRLTNIKRGRALILDANNQIVGVPFNELCDDDLCFLTAWWRVPTECTFSDEQYAERNWAPSTLTWKASALCHKPLYFEDVQLERYGHTAGPFKQPFLSGAHFFASLVTVPYQAGINPPWECRYSLGYYRPGSCAPWLVPPVPLSVRGALWEAGAIVGGAAIIP